MRRPHHTHHCRCFTLLELLAVVMLLGLLAGYTLRSVLLQPVSPKQTLRQLVAIDAEARLLARRDGPLSLTLETNEESGTTEVKLKREGLERSYSLDQLVRVESDAQTEGVLAYDRHGQSVDYVVSLIATRDKLDIAGLTGWSTINREAGEP
ncbi:MAG: type II secretion system protein [Phycisphaera sp.]|nr:MAG: type II secretion system protein [Phycisphaera sp.]